MVCCVGVSNCNRVVLGLDSTLVSHVFYVLESYCGEFGAGGFGVTSDQLSSGGSLVLFWVARNKTSLVG